MFCKNCGKEIEENVKFCSSCGTEVENETPVNNSPQPETPLSVEKVVVHETVQQKKWDSPEKILSALAAFVVFGTVIMPFLTDLLFGFSSDGFGYVLRGILIAGVLFGVAMFIHSKRPLTDHYKYKCPYCNEENTVAADETKTFNCSKCKKNNDDY